MMPVVFLMSLCVGLGLWMGWQFLRRAKNNPMHIGFHLILGLASLEATAMLMRGAMEGHSVVAGSSGKYAALVLALAVIAGFATSVVARRWSRQTGGLVLATHAALGTVGFVMFLAWVFNL